MEDWNTLKLMSNLVDLIKKEKEKAKERGEHTEETDFDDDDELLASECSKIQ